MLIAEISIGVVFVLFLGWFLRGIVLRVKETTLDRELKRTGNLRAKVETDIQQGMIAESIVGHLAQATFHLGKAATELSQLKTWPTTASGIKPGFVAVGSAANSLKSAMADWSKRMGMYAFQQETPKETPKGGGDVAKAKAKIAAAAVAAGVDVGKIYTAMREIASVKGAEAFSNLTEAQQDDLLTQAKGKARV